MKEIRKRKKGFSLLELLLVLAVFAGVVGIGITIYSSYIEPQLQMSRIVNNFQVLVSAIERIKDSNRGAYPAGSITNLGSLNSQNPTTLERLLRGVLGSTNPALTNWRYNCPSGGTSLTLTLNVPELSLERREGLSAMLTQNYNNIFSCSVDGTNNNLINCVRNNIVCQ